MRKLIVLFALAAGCSHQAEYQPDAYQPDALQPDASEPDAGDHITQDAPPDAPKARDCMGNLPASRTATVDDSDPVPSGLLNELQDRDIAVNGPRPLIIGGAAFCDDSFAGGTATRLDSVWTLTAGGGGAKVIADLHLPPGTKIIEVRVSGNLKVGENLQNRVFRRSIGDGGATQGNVLNITSNPATGAWTLSANPVFPPIEIEDGFLYELSIATFTGSPFLFDGVRLVIQDG
jgi:hypothetical protein